MSTSREKVLTRKCTVYVTPAMWQLLTQVANRRKCKPNDLVREAVRLFLDQEEGVVGSKRHFQKSLQTRVDQLEHAMRNYHQQQQQTILFYLHVIMQMLAFGLTHLLSRVTNSNIQPHQFIQRSIATARKEEALLAQQVQVVREMEALEQGE